MDFVSDTFSKSLLHGLYTQINSFPVYQVRSQKNWHLENTKKFI